MLLNEQLSKLKKESIGIGYMIPTRIITKPKFDQIPEESETTSLGDPETDRPWGGDGPTQDPCHPSTEDGGCHYLWKEIQIPITPPTPEEETPTMATFHDEITLHNENEGN